MSIKSYNFAYNTVMMTKKLNKNHLLLMILSLIMSLQLFGKNDDCRDIIIPADVISIADFEFANNDSIRSVTFANGSKLTTIGEYAFYRCHNLEKITLPESVEKLGMGCFQECTNLKHIYVPSKVTALPRYFCAWDCNLQSAILPYNLTDIGSHAFAYCSELNNISLPEKIEHIGSNAFSFCSSMTDISFPDSITELESYIMAECTSLQNAKLPGNEYMLGELIFSGCNKLHSITILSSEPPTFDCNSSLFEPDNKALFNRCKLKVKPGKQKIFFSSPGWNLFKDIISCD
jgi:hypothetical protein